MTPDAWLAAVWPFVEANLPPPPAGVLEIGCGPTVASFRRCSVAGTTRSASIRKLRRAARTSEGVRAVPPGRAGGRVVACTSLHHVADLGEVLRRIADSTRPGREAHRGGVGPGAIRRVHRAVVLRPARPGRGGRPRADGCTGAGTTGSPPAGRGRSRCAPGRKGEGLHTGGEILGALEAHFEPRSLTRGPYFFADLADTAETDEQAAIDAGEIQATGIRYIGTPRRP